MSDKNCPVCGGKGVITFCLSRRLSRDNIYINCYECNKYYEIEEVIKEIMDNIKVEEYVRTYDGIIGKIKYEDSTNIYIITKDGEIKLSSGIKKRKEDLIELIEQRRLRKRIFYRM